MHHRLRLGVATTFATLVSAAPLSLPSAATAAEAAPASAGTKTAHVTADSARPDAQRTNARKPKGKRHKNKPKRLPLLLPTTYTLVRTVCTQTDTNTWDVLYTWRVTGGRYQNLGNGYRLTRGVDNVYRGAARTLHTQTSISGMWDGPTAPPETDTAKFSQFVAPIGRSRQYREIRKSIEVNLSCG